MIRFQDFFREKFEYDLQANLSWCNLFSQIEENIPDYVSKSMSHIINVHHIWNARLLNLPAESESWDLLPSLYWGQLHQDNFRKTMCFLEYHDTFENVNFYDSEGVPMEKKAIDILYHALNHSNYHRAQISKACRDIGLPVISTNFIHFIKS